MITFKVQLSDGSWKNRVWLLGYVESEGARTFSLLFSEDGHGETRGCEAAQPSFLLPDTHPLHLPQVHAHPGKRSEDSRLSVHLELSGSSELLVQVALDRFQVWEGWGEGRSSLLLASVLQSAALCLGP